jgi:hypothetical protein
MIRSSGTPTKVHPSRPGDASLHMGDVVNWRTFFFFFFFSFSLNHAQSTPNARPFTLYASIDAVWCRDVPFGCFTKLPTWHAPWEVILKPPVLAGVSILNLKFQCTIY